jgi:hypothetical protein
MAPVLYFFNYFSGRVSHFCPGPAWNFDSLPVPQA